MIKKIKKLLYLLQLEEYQNKRYWGWLEKHKIEELEERKKQLHWTARTVWTLLITLALTPVLKTEKAVGWANQIIDIPFSLIKKKIIFQAKLKLKLYPRLIKIVITGSYGKTSFKEMLAWVLEDQFEVLKTPENINTRVGIARLVLSKLKSNHQILIVEAGAYQQEEIKDICQLIKPNFGIVTIIGLMHLERFKTQANIQKAKLEITPFIKDKKQLFLPKKDNQFIDFSATVLKIAQQIGLSEDKAKIRLKSFSFLEHRLSEKKVNKNLTILDNSYSSNPLGNKRALEKLNSFKKHQKIVVTPGMIEFGAKQFKLNANMGQEAAAVADILIIIGETNKKALLLGAKKGKRKTKIICLGKDEDWSQKLQPLLQPPAVVLLENDLPDHYL